MKWDLAQLYSQLDLQPDCSLEEFKRTYWRRIAELHPDKGANAGTPEGSLLPQLVWLYAAATRFHRRYGRLPGAAPMRKPGAGLRTPARRPTVAAFETQPAMIRSTPSQAMPEAPLRRDPLPIILLFAILLLLALLWDWSKPVTQEQLVSAAEEVRTPEANFAATARYLKLGMDAATVLAIQGRPLHMSDTQWDYGPSWLEFQKGRLVGWHSSPLRELRTATPSPVPEPARFAE